MPSYPVLDDPAEEDLRLFLNDPTTDFSQSHANSSVSFGSSSFLTANDTLDQTFHSVHTSQSNQTQSKSSEASFGLFSPTISRSHNQDRPRTATSSTSANPNQPTSASGHFSQPLSTSGPTISPISPSRQSPMPMSPSGSTSIPMSPFRLSTRPISPSR